MKWKVRSHQWAESTGKVETEYYLLIRSLFSLAP